MNDRNDFKEGVPYSKVVLGDMHRLLLETLRQREQQIIQYLAILVPAFTGFGWLLWNKDTSHQDVFIYGTLAVLGLLLLGAFYSINLGYNYRYIILQLTKLEIILEVDKAMLAAWPRTRKGFSRYKLCGIIPNCFPPGIIKIFWYAFIFGIFGVSSVSYYITNQKILLIVGSISSVISLSLPFYYGQKFQALLDKEFTNGSILK